jgi:4-alpha-glucanotransferase
LAWLKSQQLLSASWSDVNSDCLEEKPFDGDLCAAILSACARSQSRIMLFQLDDLQLLEAPVNIPGTDREYPNWRRKQKLDTSLLFADSNIQALMASISRERKR